MDQQGGQLAPSGYGAGEQYGAMTTTGGAEGQVEEYYGNGQVANSFPEGKGKGEAFMQNEKLWLFGEKKPLSIQSYGSLPVEVGLLCYDACVSCRWTRPVHPGAQCSAASPLRTPRFPAAQLGGRLA